MTNRILLVFLAMVLVVSLVAFGACAPPEEFTLKITAIGEGTTSPEPGTSTITEGESVTVTAIPNTGYELGYWEGDVSGTDDSVTFKMTSDKSVVAVFVEVEEWEWPETFIMGTLGIGGSGHAQGVAIATVLEESTGMKVRVIPTESFAVMMHCLKHGVYDLASRELGFIGAWDMEAIPAGGTASRDLGPFQVRVVWSQIQLFLCPVVRGDSDIQTIYDLKPGVKMSYNPGIPGSYDYAVALAAWAGLDEEDVVFVPFGTWAGSIRCILDGTCDVALPSPTAPVTLEIAAGPHGIRCVELPYDEDPEGMARCLAVESSISFGICNIGIEELMGKRVICLATMEVATAETDPELIYHLVKWQQEHYADLEAAHPQNIGMDVDFFRSLLDTNPIPVHEGTIEYLREIGMWTADDDARQAYNIALLDRYIDAYQEAIAKADAQGIEVDPTNEEWLELWENYKEELNLPHFVAYTQVPQ